MLDVIKDMEDSKMTQQQRESLHSEVKPDLDAFMKVGIFKINH